MKTNKMECTNYRGPKEACNTTNQREKHNLYSITIIGNTMYLLDHIYFNIQISSSS